MANAIRMAGDSGAPGLCPTTKVYWQEASLAGVMSQPTDEIHRRWVRIPIATTKASAWCPPIALRPGRPDPRSRNRVCRVPGEPQNRGVSDFGGP